MRREQLSFDSPISANVPFDGKPSHPKRKSRSPEGTIGADIDPPLYAQEQHDTWTKLYAGQYALLEGNACPEYLLGHKAFDFPPNVVPELKTVSSTLERLSGWELMRVEGFVPAHNFFKLLANKLFPSSDFLRHPDELLYTPAPDMFHDLMGHMPLFNHKRFADFFHTFGVAGVNAKSEEHIEQLGRIYWFTVEFGLINPTAHRKNRDPSQARIYGAGIISSVGEIPYSLGTQVKVTPFDIDRIANKPYDIYHMQEEIFEIESFDELQSEFFRWSRQRGLLI